jgi:ATP-dependent Lon protease
VLPIGGLKEKLLAALRGGISTVLIPAENEKDLAEIPAPVKEQLEIIPVAMSTRCWRALTQRFEPIEWTMRTSMRPNRWSIRTLRRKVRHSSLAL